MAYGAKNYVGEQDLSPLLPGDDSQNLGKKLEKALEKQ